MNPFSHRGRSAYLVIGLLALLALPALQAQKVPEGSEPATPDEVDEYAVVHVSDPLEPVNRAIFTFNDHVYDYVLRPVSKGYKAVVPAPARRGIGNFFDNIRFPVRFVSCLLQGKFARSARETEKFVVNTVAGLGGFIRISDDVPALANLPREDIGQTLGVWGIYRGPYLVLPILGPGTVRDTVGAVGDYFLSPMHWDLQRNMDGYTWEIGTVLDVTDAVNSLPLLIDAYDAPRKDALDPYVAVRTAYVQYRDAAVKK